MDACVQFVSEHITPVVMVICSPEVDRVCAKSGLTLAQMLRPCGYLRHIDGAPDPSRRLLSSSRGRLTTSSLCSSPPHRRAAPSASGLYAALLRGQHDAAAESEGC